MMRRIPFLLSLFGPGAGILLLILTGACSPSEALSAGERDAGARDAGVRLVAGGVEFPAIVTRRAFERDLLGFGMPGYHLIVWEEGKAAGSALFRTGVSDREVLDALESLGAVPGNALGMDSWEERKNPASPAPDRVIAGAPVEVLVKVPGRAAPLTLGEILEDPGGRGFAMRFGGHRANIPAWHSGCVVCLYSCPGSKVGNARYTVRDYVLHDEAGEAARFRVREGALPPDGTEVTILFRLLDEGG